MRVDLAGGTLSHQKAVAVLDDKRGEMAGGCRRPRAEVRIMRDAPGTEGAAVRAQGAPRALRLFGGAEERAQFHERLVEMGAGAELRISDCGLRYG